MSKSNHILNNYKDAVLLLHSVSYMLPQFYLKEHQLDLLFNDSPQYQAELYFIYLSRIPPQCVRTIVPE